jgi:hypothetical protein
MDETTIGGYEVLGELAASKRFRVFRAARRASEGERGGTVYLMTDEVRHSDLFIQTVDAIRAAWPFVGSSNREEVLPSPQLDAGRPWFFVPDVLPVAASLRIVERDAFNSLRAQLRWLEEFQPPGGEERFAHGDLRKERLALFDAKNPLLIAPGWVAAADYARGRGLSHVRGDDAWHLAKLWIVESDHSFVPDGMMPEVNGADRPLKRQLERARDPERASPPTRVAAAPETAARAASAADAAPPARAVAPKSPRPAPSAPISEARPARVAANPPRSARGTPSVREPRVLPEGHPFREAVPAQETPPPRVAPAVETARPLAAASPLQEAPPVRDEPTPMRWPSTPAPIPTAPPPFAGSTTARAPSGRRLEPSIPPELDELELEEPVAPALPQAALSPEPVAPPLRRAPKAPSAAAKAPSTVPLPPEVPPTRAPPLDSPSAQVAPQLAPAPVAPNRNPILIVALVALVLAAAFVTFVMLRR